MSFADAAALVREILNTELLTIGGTPLTLASVLTSLAIFYVTWRLGNITRRATVQGLGKTGVGDLTTQTVISKLARYAVLLVGSGLALKTVGVDLGGMFAAGAVFAVGIGFAMQNIAQNFVSGIILLVERSIKPGDVLEVDGRVVRVEELGIRACLARTRDDDELIIPNSTLVQSTVTNYTLHDSRMRLKIFVGVAYESDLKLVHRVLLERARSMPWRLKEPEPTVLLTEFGDSTVNFEIAVWVDDPWRSRGMESLLRHAIWDGLHDNGIEIAFPQVDVHFDPGVMTHKGPAN